MKKRNQGNSLTDSELVRNYIENGDNAAFTHLLERYRSRVYNHILFTVRDEDLANDLYQDTCIKVFTMLRDGKYNEEGKFGAWLMRVTTNIMMDHFRRSAPVSEPLYSNEKEKGIDLYNLAELSEPSIEKLIIDEQIKDSAVMLMNALPESQREILELRFYEDLSFKEIANMKGMSINTALGRMHYAVNNMRKLAKKHSVALSA